MPSPSTYHKQLGAYIAAVREFEEQGIGRMTGALNNVLAAAAALPVPGLSPEIEAAVARLGEAVSGLSLSAYARDVVTPAVKAALKESI